jgi:hypothetical protein
LHVLSLAQYRLSAQFALAHEPPRATFGVAPVHVPGQHVVLESQFESVCVHCAVPATLPAHSSVMKQAPPVATVPVNIFAHGSLAV